MRLSGARRRRRRGGGVAGAGDAAASGGTRLSETRPPVEGRDSLSVEHVLDTASASIEDPLSGELKTACYVPPTQCSVAVRRAVEPTLVTRGTSPMSTSDMDVLPDISAALCRAVPCRAAGHQRTADERHRDGRRRRRHDDDRCAVRRELVVIVGLGGGRL